MSLLQFIPDFLDSQPELAFLIFQAEKLKFEALLAYTKLEQVRNEMRMRRKRKRRSVWVRPYLRRRVEKGHYENLMQELAEEDPVLYTNFLRVGEDIFNEIVERVRPYIEKQTTWWRMHLTYGGACRHI